MNRVLVVGEDALTCALGEKLISSVLPDWSLAGPSINKGGITKLRAELPRFAQQAKHVQPVLCVADTDGECVKEFLARWSPGDFVPQFLLRLAVTEAEGWVMADRNGFSDFFQIALNKLPYTTDDLNDPKSLMLQLLGRSKRKIFREEMVSNFDRSKQGAGYNLHLCAFVRNDWNVDRALAASPSLRRAKDALKRLEGIKIAP